MPTPKPTSKPTPGTKRLLPPLSSAQESHFDRLDTLLNEIAPLPARHRKTLPAAIADLSAQLTGRRDERARDYMTQPRYLAAYLRYFLPWNLYRQTRLLSGLLAGGLLDLPSDARIVDLGAGPVTFLLALWLAQTAEARSLPLHYVAVDHAGKALTLGRQLFAALADDPRRSWRVSTVKGAVMRSKTEAANLLVAANLLNELTADAADGGSGGGSDGGSAAGLRTWADRTLADSRKRLAPGGRLLVIEPGTRSAARRLFALRAAAVTADWTPLSPCTHAAACPLPARRNTSWCHFTARPNHVPHWLLDRSRRAGLPKERVALSFLLLDTAAEAETSGGFRVVSGPLDLPGRCWGHYACGEKGLIVVRCPRGGQTLESGGWLPASGLRPAGKDAHTGAPMVDLLGGAG